MASPARRNSKPMRLRTGLRNRFRKGRSAYSRKGKSKKAERYDRPFLDHPNHPSGAKYGCCTKKGEMS